MKQYRQLRKIIGLLVVLTVMLTNFPVAVNATGTGNKTTTSKNKWVQEEGNWYYYINGKKKTGWLEINNKWYHFNDKGALHIGWFQIGDKWYYANSYGVMRTGWIQDGNKWYYTDNWGRMQTGWKQISNKWYYFNKTGTMHTGWKKIGSKWYYFDKNGVMQTGLVVVSGKTYNFGKNGVLIGEVKDDPNAAITDNSMKLNSEFTVDCWTPAGMKPKKIIAQKCDKKELNTIELSGEDELEILKYYDEYYGLYQYNNFYKEYSNGGAPERNKAILKYYSNMLSKLEVVYVKINYSRRWNPSISDVNICCNYDDFYNHTLLFADSKNGKSFLSNEGEPTSVAMQKGVYIRRISWSRGDRTRFYNNYGESIYLVDTGYSVTEIIKPKDFKGLCIGVAGDALHYNSSDDLKYYNNTYDFKKTSWYKYPKNTKWMNVK